MSTDGGTGSGYASMLRCSKPKKPSNSTTGNSTAMNLRCLSAKVMIAFMRVRPGASRCSPRLRGAIDEQAAACHDLLARLQTLQNLHHAAADTAGVNGPQGQRIVGAQHPDARRFAFPYYRLFRNGQRIGRTAGDDAEAGKHLRFELAV